MIPWTFLPRPASLLELVASTLVTLPYSPSCLYTGSVPIPYLKWKCCPLQDFLFRWSSFPFKHWCHLLDCAHTFIAVIAHIEELDIVLFIPLLVQHIRETCAQSNHLCVSDAGNICGILGRKQNQVLQGSIHQQVRHS
jgi:hypothetical protein